MNHTQQKSLPASSYWNLLGLGLFFLLPETVNIYYYVQKNSTTHWQAAKTLLLSWRHWDYDGSLWDVYLNLNCFLITLHTPCFKSFFHSIMQIGYKEDNGIPWNVHVTLQIVRPFQVKHIFQVNFLTVEYIKTQQMQRHFWLYEHALRSNVTNICRHDY